MLRRQNLQRQGEIERLEQELAEYREGLTSAKAEGVAEERSRALDLVRRQRMMADSRGHHAAVAYLTRVQEAIRGTEETSDG